MKKTFSFTILGLLLVALLGTAFAYRGDPTTTGPYYDEERHDAMLEAFENTDYQAWYELMTEDGRYPGILKFVNEDNFATFVELRDARLDGDTELIEELEEELGLHQGMGKYGGQGNRNRNRNYQKGMGSGNCIYNQN